MEDPLQLFYWVCLFLSVRVFLSIQAVSLKFPVLLGENYFWLVYGIY